MKNSIVVALVLCFVSSAAFSQTVRPPKGPKAKNQKPWEKQVANTATYQTMAQRVVLKGPKAKNQRPSAISTNKVSYGAIGLDVCLTKIDAGETNTTRYPSIKAKRFTTEKEVTFE